MSKSKEVEVKALQDFQVPTEPTWHKGDVRTIPRAAAEQFVEQGLVKIHEPAPAPKHVAEPEAGPAPGKDAAPRKE